MSTDTIGSGKDHTTIADWFAAIPATTVEAEVGLMTGTFTITADLTFSGKTATASFNITLKPDTGQSFVDSKDDVGFKLQYDASQGTAITSTTNYREINITQRWFEMHQVQSFMNSNGYADYGVRVFGGDILVQDCIINFEGYNGQVVLPIDNDSGSNSKAVNCLIIDRSSPAGGADAGALLNYGTQLINCTIIRIGTANEDGCQEDYGTTNVVKNTAVFNWGDAFQGAASRWGSGTDYNGSDETTAANLPGANSVGSLTMSDQFESVTDDFRLKSGSGLEGVGNTDSNFPNDILGTVRGVGTAGDIGCHEFPAAGGGGSILPQMMQLHHDENLGAMH